MNGDRLDYEQGRADDHLDRELVCLDDHRDEPCEGSVQYRMALSGTGRQFPRCDRHWAIRLAWHEETMRRYPEQRPADFDPLFAGERWDEDDPWP